MAHMAKLAIHHALKRIQLKTAPLLNIPYAVQLKMKEVRASHCLRHFTSLMRKSPLPPCEEFNRQIELHNGLPCEVEPIRHIDINLAFRNKITATIGYDNEGKPCVGHSFRFCNKDIGVNRLVTLPIHELPLFSPQQRVVLQRFQEYLPHSTLAPIAYPGNGLSPTGNWASLMLRNNRHQQYMLHVSLNPQNLSPQNVEDAKRELIDQVLLPCRNEGVDLVSLQWLLSSKVAYDSDGIPSEMLWGRNYLTETLMGCEFRVSARSFFQVRTDAAELLYSTTLEQLKDVDAESTLLLDLCCGTGTLGILMARKVSHVIGVDWEEAAIMDAKENAARNGIHNIEHHCADVEEFLADFDNRAKVSQFKHVVAIVNPHRDGLTTRMMHKLRAASTIRQVVYLSCRAEGRPTLNFYQLCRTQKTRDLGKPFLMTKVIPLDPFPNTKHVELVINFVRT